jgi:hypothetical protein
MPKHYVEIYDIFIAELIIILTKERCVK